MAIGTDEPQKDVGLRLERKGEGIEVSASATISVREYTDVDALIARYEHGSAVISGDQISRAGVKRTDIRMGFQNFRQFCAAMNPAFRQTIVAWTQALGERGRPLAPDPLADRTVETVFRGRAQFGRMAHTDSEVELVLFGFSLSDFVDAKAALTAPATAGTSVAMIPMYPVCRLTMSTVAVPHFFQTCDRVLKHLPGTA
jgi:hypothetical protein